MQTEEVSLCEIFYQKNEISQVLQVSISQLTTYLPETTSELISTTGRSRKSTKRLTIQRRILNG